MEHKNDWYFYFRKRKYFIGLLLKQKLHELQTVRSQNQVTILYEKNVLQSLSFNIVICHDIFHIQLLYLKRNSSPVLLWFLWIYYFVTKGIICEKYKSWLNWNVSLKRCLWPCVLDLSIWGTPVLCNTLVGSFEHDTQIILFWGYKQILHLN